MARPTPARLSQPGGRGGGGGGAGGRMGDFEAAVRHVRALPAAGSGAAGAPSAAQRLRFYALYKQAAKGDARGARPGLLDPVGRAKFDAWAGLRGKPPAEARALYVELLRRLDPSFRASGDSKIVEAPETGHSKNLGGDAGASAGAGAWKGRGLARGSSIRAHELDVAGEASVDPGGQNPPLPPRREASGAAGSTHSGRGGSGAGAGAGAGSGMAAPPATSESASALASTLVELHNDVQKKLMDVTARLETVEADVAALRAASAPQQSRQYDVLGLPLGTALFVASWPVLCYSLWGGRLERMAFRRR